MPLRIFASEREKQGLAKDVIALQQFLQSRQQLSAAEQGLSQLRGLPPEQRGGLVGPNFPAFQQFPTAQSRAGGELFSRFLLQQQQGQQQGQQPFTLAPGQQRFAPGGQPIAQVPLAPKPRAGALQIARPGDQTGLPIGTVFQADPQGNVKIISEAGGAGLTTKDRSQIAITQAREFRADPRIKNFQIIERSERGMQAALKQATSPNVKSRIASDQALGVLFQKMLDPASVVRESEFARTPEGAAAVNRLLAIAPQLRLGGLRLLDEDRRALVDMAQKLLGEAKISANRAFGEFGIRADELGLNKKIIFGGAKPFGVPGMQDLLQRGMPETPQILPPAIQGKAITPTPLQFTPEQIDAELRRRRAIQ